MSISERKREIKRRRQRRAKRLRQRAREAVGTAEVATKGGTSKPAVAKVASESAPTRTRRKEKPAE